MIELDERFVALCFMKDSPSGTALWEILQEAKEQQEPVVILVTEYEVVDIFEGRAPGVFQAMLRPHQEQHHRHDDRDKGESGGILIPA